MGPTRPLRPVLRPYRAPPPRTWPAPRPALSRRAGPGRASARLPVRETPPPRRRPPGTGLGRPTALARWPRPRQGRWLPGPDARLAGRGGKQDRSPRPGHDGPPFAPAGFRPDRPPSAPEDDGTGPGPRTRSIPPPWPVSLRRLRSRAARPPAPTRARRPAARRRRRGAGAVSRPGAPRPAGTSPPRRP